MDIFPRRKGGSLTTWKLRVLEGYKQESKTWDSWFFPEGPATKSCLPVLHGSLMTAIHCYSLLSNLYSRLFEEFLDLLKDHLAETRGFAPPDKGTVPPRRGVEAPQGQ